MRSLFFLLALTACSGATFTGIGGDDGGPGEADPDTGSPTDSNTDADPTDSGGQDRVDPPGDSSTDAKDSGVIVDGGVVDSGIDSGSCIQNNDFCNWDIDAQAWGTQCCTKKCAMNQQQQWKCTP